MSSHASVHRSLRRWLSMLLGETWTLRMEERGLVVPDDKRPMGNVIPVPGATSQTLFARASIPQGDVQRGQTFTVTLYPPITGDVRECRNRAQLLAESLDDAVVSGVSYSGPPIPGLGVQPGQMTYLDRIEFSVSPPLRLPLWNYSGVPVTGASRAGPDDPVGWMEAEDVAVQAIPDPEDDKRWTVQCTLRVTWWDGGRARELLTVPPDATSVPPTFIASVP
jgi:hypothetical protein